MRFAVRRSFDSWETARRDTCGPPLAPRPDRAGIPLLGRRHPFEYQLLHSSGGLREIDIAFGVSRDVMARSQNAERLDRAHDIERLAINDGNAFVGAYIQELLSSVGGQRQIACKSRTGSDQLLHEPAIVSEHLNAPVFPIGQIHHPIVGHADSMRDIEMRGSLGIRKGLWRDDCTALLAARPLAKGTPVCTENSVRIDYVSESPNVSRDDRSVLPLPGPVRLAVQVEGPT